MKQNRREFLTAASCLGAVSVLGQGKAAEERKGGDTMLGFAAPPLAKVRVAVAPSSFNNSIGVLSLLPGVEITALCAENEEDLKRARAFLERRKSPPAKEYVGVDACRRMVDDRVADVFYNGLPSMNDVDLNVYAMNGKMHVFFLPPVYCDVADCWKLVKASEENKVHCASLGNNYYASDALFALNVIRRGLLGDIVSGEVTYFRDARAYFRDGNALNVDRWGARMSRKGVSFPWDRPFASILRCLDVNHGDRLETVVSLSSARSSIKAFEKDQKSVTIPVGVKETGCDMSAALVRTSKGRLVTLRHALALSCPYHATFALYGTKGAFCSGGFSDIKMTYDSVSGGSRAQRFFDEKTMKGMQEKFRHPLGEKIGEVARKLGGYGGASFVEEMYRIYCLRYGLPLGTDVYDFAAMASLAKMTYLSAQAGGKIMKVPDFTRGAWKAAAPRPIEEIDVEKVFNV